MTKLLKDGTNMLPVPRRYVLHRRSPDSVVGAASCLEPFLLKNVLHCWAAPHSSLVTVG